MKPAKLKTPSRSPSIISNHLTEDQLPKAYDASKFEADIYTKWENSGAFKAKVNPKKKPFSIIMPPPNATGTLHLGHAVMLALEDIMIRYHRMKGDETLWLPGTDHAAIATQNRVEKNLAARGITRHDLGREKFLKEVEAFVETSKETIRNQVRKMGSSCDWSRESYTLDAGPSLAVRTVFKGMFDDGLIYRGNRTVNWCTRCQSTLADDEVDYKESKGKLYVFKYDLNFPFEIATTRPETKLGDVGVAVHPDDKRFKKYLYKKFDVTFAGGKKLTIEVFPDKSIDPAFGTGAVGITPAHSHVDFEMYERHAGSKAVRSLHNVINEEGVVTEFDGKSVKQTREEIVMHLELQGLMKEVQDITHNVGSCYRCGTTVEVILSTQWFIDVDKKIPKRNKTLKQLSLDAVKKGGTEILPEKFEKIYFHWMNNLHNWCISRQLWFGHQIPVWYCGTCENKPIVSVETPSKCPTCKSKDLTQDPDVLDTWFSAGLWTFSTLGWPKKTKELEYFHPTSVLETGYDILFFWVARMILMTTYALNEVPFKTVYLHGLVRTRSGEKMSKSKPDSCIDPLDMIDKYGADALRLSMVIGGAPGNDMRLYEEKIAGYRNFVNKIWNASRFILLNVSTEDLNKKFSKKDVTSTADKWIMTRLQHLTKDATKQIEKYNFSEAGTQIYDFLWNEMCNWYIEFSKGEHKNPAVLIHALKTTLKLLHPFVPYVTEAIWSLLGEKKFIMLEPWPRYDASLVFTAEAKKIEHLYTAITTIRKTKSEYKIDPVKKIDATIYGGTLTDLIWEKKEAIMRLGNLSNLEIAKKGSSIPQALKILAGPMEIYLPLQNMFNLEQELERISKEKKQISSELAAINGRLGNQSFVANAPKEVVSQAKEQAAQLTEQLENLAAHEKSLEKAAKI